MQLLDSLEHLTTKGMPRGLASDKSMKNSEILHRSAGVATSVAYDSCRVQTRMEIPWWTEFVQQPYSRTKFRGERISESETGAS